MLKFKLPDKVYETLKWICLIVIPAINVLWTTLGTTWGWSYVDPISKTITAVALFLGSIIGVSTINYRSNLPDEDEYTEDNN